MPENNILEKYITELLHVDEGTGNKLINLGSKPRDTFVIKPSDGMSVVGYGKYFFEYILKPHFGRIATTVMRNSAKDAEQIIGPGTNVVDWDNFDGEKYPLDLDSFISKAIDVMAGKGNNPVFLSLGAIRWDVMSNDGTFREIVSPLLVFPVKLIRAGSTQPVAIEFVEDDVYFNDCLFYKLRESLGVNVSDRFPLPTTAFNDDRTIDIAKLDLNTYFSSVQEFVNAALEADVQNKTKFVLERDLIAIAKYEHEDMCVYYDLRRNEDGILAHPVINKVFGNDTERIENKCTYLPRFIKQYDSVQEEIVRRALGGENMKVQGPPGTGKTQTIANLIATLMGAGKKVLFVSKKIAALTEVYNKLPALLQNFVLKMSTESESDIATEKPIRVHSVLRSRYNLVPSLILGDDGESKVRSRSDVLLEQRKNILEQLNWYYRLVFADEQFCGRSFYHVLADYCELYDVEPIVFLDKKKVLTISSQQYETALINADEASKHFDVLTAHGKHFAIKCPWYGVIAETSDKALDAGRQTVADTSAAAVAVEKLVAVEPMAERFSLADLVELTRVSFSPEQIVEYAGIKGLNNMVDRIASLVGDYSAIRERIADYKTRCPVAFEQGNIPARFNYNEKLSDMTLGALRRITAAKHVYNTDKGVLADKISLVSLLTVLKAYDDALTSAAKYCEVFNDVFKKEFLTDCKEAKLIEQSYSSLDKYIAENADTVPSWNILATGKIKKLKEISLSPKYMKDKDILVGVGAFHSYFEQLALAQEKLFEVSSMLYTDMAPEEMKDLYSVVLHTTNFATFCELVNTINQSWTACEQIIKPWNCPEILEWTVGELVELCTLIGKERVLTERFDLFNTSYERISADDRPVPEGAYPILSMDDSPELLESKVASFGALSKAVALFADCTDMPFNVQRLIGNIRENLDGKYLTDKLSKMVEFASVFTSGSQYSDLSKVTLSDLKIYVSEIGDQTKLSAMREFSEKLDNSAELELKEFFRPFVNGFRRENERYSFVKIFRHSICSAIISTVKELLGEKQFELSRQNLEGLISRFSEIENELFTVNTKLIALDCLKSVDAKQPEFRFLQNERSDYRVCRLMFKEKAASIMKLINCFIMSPSTVSVLFRSEEFAKFDVVIIDEGSQLAPQYAVPAVYRAKQCIIMGDEYQMPPIKHFVKRTVDNREEEGREQIDSCLDIIRKNNAFTSMTLRCHYRSLTESLIAYSQYYYDDMLTFPSAVPHNADIGMRDIFIEDATAAGGVNEAEAVKAVEVLKEHFERYYKVDPETGRASIAQSVGVVVFGEKQLARISAIINRDVDLANKVNKVQADCEGPKEKVFFLRTVEKVQGQEIDHMILSITYGKTAEGNVGSFGQLNQGKVGEKIFNVAVSRAKTQITVIHSVKPVDLEYRKSIDYIQRFLRIVEEYSDSGSRGGFFSNVSDNWFVKDIAKYIEDELGVSPNRIVINFGATEKSLRIPIVVLSPDRSHAELGIFCEVKPMVGGKPINYIDYTIRYVNSMLFRGWTATRVFIYDWINNGEHAKIKLKETISNNITL